MVPLEIFFLYALFFSSVGDIDWAAEFDTFMGFDLSFASYKFTFNVSVSAVWVLVPEADVSCLSSAGGLWFYSLLDW